MRVLIFGDTQGYRDTEGGWADKLRKHYDELQVQDFGKGQPTIFNLGISADDSRNVLSQAEAEIREGYAVLSDIVKPHLVTLLAEAL